MLEPIKAKVSQDSDLDGGREVVGVHINRI